MTIVVLEDGYDGGRNDTTSYGSYTMLIMRAKNL